MELVRPFTERIKSRKFIMALLAAVTAFIKVYYPEFPEEAMYTIAACMMGYVAIEGGVDAAAQLARWLAQKNPKDGK